jgi:acetylornithine/N-succinyldiaminopimelate aminotransferase
VKSGVLHGDSIFWYPGHELLLGDVVRAENCHLYDSAGRKYVDLESGVWATSIGHSHPRVRRAIEQQSARIAHTGFGYSNPVVREAAREILSLLGLEGGRCVFLCSGSEAVEYGVRLAQLAVGQPLLLTLSDSYFGAYGSASKRHPDEWHSFDWGACADCQHAGSCDSGCEHWAAIPFGLIGGFLFEPGSSSGFVRFPPERLIRAIAAAVRDHDGLVLVNEVTTGIGRTGSWFGFQHYGVAPDIVALGKGIGNGYPVSVTAASLRAIEQLGDRTLKYAQSHQNDPLGAAIAREVVRVIKDEGLIERGRGIAARLGNGLEAIRSRTRQIKDVRQRGLMAAVELHDGPGTPFTIQIHRDLVRRGYVVGRRPGVPVLRLDPSLTIESGDVEGFLKTLEEVLADATGLDSQAGDTPFGAR